MHDLTARQVEILKSLIEEYIETAEAVGSETLEKKHNLSASPATIRNEMVRLTELGYLKKPHVSAGRVPTPMGMKFYVKQLMKEKDLSVAEEVSLKEKVWDLREKERDFLREVTKTLADRTKTLAVTTTDEGEIFCAGYANILDMPEFLDIDLTKNLLTAIDESQFFNTLFSGQVEDEDIHILLGEELGPGLVGPYGFVYTRYHTPLDFNGEIGVLGPARLNYTNIVPTVRYFGDLIGEIAKGW
jgi:transcriptional regulator of heat shock response